MYSDALSYPLRSSGWIMILIGAVLAVVLGLADDHFHSVRVRSVSSYVLLIKAVGLGYLSVIYLSVVGTTMTGSDDMPGWPDVTSFREDIFEPFLNLLFLTVLSFGPAAAIVFFADKSASWYSPALIGSAAWGCFYLPMAVIAHLFHGTLGFALPHVVIPAVVRALPDYLPVVAAMLGGFGAFIAAQRLASAIPFAGTFLTAAISIYCLMFQGRLTGLIYREKSEQLGWE